MDRWNNTEPTTDLTFWENHKTFPFLDILLMNNNNKLEFKVCHNSTNKNDHINSKYS